MQQVSMIEPSDIDINDGKYGAYKYRMGQVTHQPASSLHTTNCIS